MVDLTHPSVYLSMPDSFHPFPADLPHIVPPPVKTRSLSTPFNIDVELYNLALRPEVPIIFASTYILAVFTFNAYNRDNHYKPWRISTTRAFHYFVILHNVSLTIFSALTFLGMVHGVANVWPGWSNDAGAAGIVDAFCKLHGPRVLGDAITYNTTLNIWESKNPLIRLLYDGTPDTTDLGRWWNEGLGFWGWLFYVSKFYEILDTLIIIAKGKRSATLQTYHHAGAMLSMWAGIRYMSPPIWMFVLVNSGIHVLMYTYYTLSALGYQVPRGLKRGLTTMQILQFVFGASFAAVHLFIQYDAPITTPYEVTNIVQRVVSAASEVSASATSAVSAVSAAVSSPLATASMGAYLKKMLLRAAGEEGVAERVHNERGELTNPKIADKIQHFYEKTFETHYRTDSARINCLDTSGQAFAIYLNLFYLLPLTWLFGKFFVRAYSSRGKIQSPSHAAKQVISSAEEAEERIEKSFEKVESKAARKVTTIKNESRQESHSTEHHESPSREVKSRVAEEPGAWLGSKLQSTSETVNEQVGRTTEWVQQAVPAVTETISTQAEKAGSWLEHVIPGNYRSIEKDFDRSTESLSAADSSSSQFENTVTNIKEEATEAASAVVNKASGTFADVVKGVNAKTTAAQAAVEDKTEPSKSSDTAAANSEEKVDDVKEKAGGAMTSAVESIQKGATQVQNAVSEVAANPKGVLDDVHSLAQSASASAPRSNKAPSRTASPDKRSGSMIPVRTNHNNKRGEASGESKDASTASSSSVKSATQSTQSSPSTAEPVVKQENVLASSQETRPGASASDVEDPLHETATSATTTAAEDSDAMGQSGIAIAAEKTDEVGDGGEGVEGPIKVETETTETEALEGGKWHPPGVNAS